MPLSRLARASTPNLSSCCLRRRQHAAAASGATLIARRGGDGSQWSRTLWAKRCWVRLKLRELRVEAAEARALEAMMRCIVDDGGVYAGKRRTKIGNDSQAWRSKDAELKKRLVQGEKR